MRFNALRNVSMSYENWRQDMIELGKWLPFAVLAYALVIIAVLFGCDNAYAYSQRETLAIVLAGEACGEGVRGMHAVGSTINNRALQRGTTPFIEATRRNQYYGLTAKNRLKLFKQCQTESLRLADLLIDGSLKDITGGALYFINFKTEKPFKWCKVKTVRIGNHEFYK